MTRLIKLLNKTSGQRVIWYSLVFIVCLHFIIEGISGAIAQGILPKQSTDLPLGTVIISALSYTEFYQGEFDPTTSIWAPCDGRSLEGSDYSIKYYKWYAPDMRSQFIRGSRVFGVPDETSPVPPNGFNPGDGEYQKEGYTYQTDMSRIHTHSGWVGSVANGHPENPKGRKGMPDMRGGKDRYPVMPSNTNAVGGTETRPMNIYVYYYIRIN